MRVVGHKNAVNYGSEGLRFLAPVPSGAKVKSSRRDVDVTWRWLRVDDEWYREFSSEVIDKRFATY